MKQNYIITADTVSYTRSYYIQENTQQHYVLCCVPHTQAQNISLFFYLERYANMTLDMVIIHANVTITIHCIMQGESSSATISGAYLLQETNEVAINTMQHHMVPHATSTVGIKGALYNDSRFTYSGMIRVEQEAQGTHAVQENKNIVFSDSARAVSMPQLEVLTHDVHCFHASAVGTFDQDQLLYVYARGLNKQQAESLLLRGFFSDMIQKKCGKDYLEQYL